MIISTLDLWSEPADAKCITTNGFLKANKKGVMGAGVAGQMQRKYPDAPAMLGMILQEYGNHVAVLRLPDAQDPTYYVAFPVKTAWYENADLDLIERSASELMELIDRMEWQKVLLPRPGCGNGKLTWGQVEPVLSPILSDKVLVIEKEKR